MNRVICCAMVMCCVLGAVTLAEANWPGFRGLSCGVAEDAFVSVITGAGAAWFGLYVSSGGKR